MSLMGQYLGGCLNAIGLTGGIATGKSSVSQILAENRVHIIDADEIAKSCVLPGTYAYKRIVKKFGNKVLHEDDSINRKALGEIVFNDKAARNALNKITHVSAIF